MLKDFRVVLVTAPQLELAEKLAQGLVSSKLAACVTLIPQAVSYYHWEGKLEKTPEVQLIIKTKVGVLPTLIRYIKEHHSSKVPEIICLPLSEGDEGYLNWVGANTLFSKPDEESPLPL